MKKSVIVICATLASWSQIACDTNNQNQESPSQEVALVSDELVNKPHVVEKKFFPDFIYDVGPRFAAIKKKDLDKATTFGDFIAKEEAQRIVSYTSLSVTILEGDDMKTDIVETSANGKLTLAQRKLLQTAPYSANLRIKADYMESYPGTSHVGPNYASPYLTIVPEKQAAYIHGMEALKEYLKTESEGARTDVDPEKLQPAKLYFTVTPQGTIENVELDRPSGYPIVDKKMIELLRKTEKEWIPAENEKGDRVAQELVVSFGLIGC